MADTFDLVIIGAGPGGYTGAIRAAQLGLKTAVVEMAPTLGGTCLNVGCIPSKALLDSSEHFHAARAELGEHGVKVGSVVLDLPTMMQRKDKIVSDLTGGIAYLFKKNKIIHFQGKGRLVDGNTVEVIDGKSTVPVKAKNVMLATGSVPNELPFMPFDGERIVSSTDALRFGLVPKHLVVVGGGVIGLELGSVWKRLGAEVTIIEFTSKICGGMDSKMSKRLQQILAKQGMNFIMEAKVIGADVTPEGATVHYESLKDGSAHDLVADKVLVATGRRPFADGLGLAEAGVNRDPQGRVEVNQHFQTSVPSVYAIGDLIRGPMLAHKAEEEGVAVAEIVAGKPGHVNYDTVPGVIYTWPEFASVGKTEDELTDAGVEYKVGSFPFSANGRAKALASTDGMVKILADTKTDKVLGVHILGPRASDMIAEAVVAMEFSASSEDIARSFHAHPTLAEVMREAALAVDGRARQM
ncbi:MAG: dihydrolipoyl dehydrogenase [Bdellovibrionaceae bacterium]|nr:dihydrolipoyl dehydrogenase [Bdellovibrionales bacterium]MCB9083336.1 dihydrolipoyl dehydrogenase [Pseudobdellovibrionaceae bacterium]